MKSWEATELNFDASTFSGLVRLFPLPNLVLYPHVMQPLHIFEERYREMLEDALAGDQMITMAVLAPGWETDYDSRPPISPYACLGKVVAHRRLPDGRYNVLLLGVQRVEIVKELDPIRSFRQARVELLDDCYVFASARQRKRMQDELLAAFRTHLPCSCELPEELETMISSQLPLGLLTDLAAYALPLAADVKLQLLAECGVRERAEVLLREVAQLAITTKKPQPTASPCQKASKSPLIYPATFSDN
jgi:ATP-dependent Lon protease